MIRILCILFCLLLAGCGRPRNQLNVFIWSEYLDPAIVAEFERLYACKVVLDYYEDPESMIAKLSGGGDSLYDIVVPSSTTLPPLVNRGLLAPLQRANIPNLANIAPEFANPSFDPGNRFGAPYLWGTTGLYVRKDPGGTMEQTWGLLFDNAKNARKFLLIDDPRSCVGAALRYLGKSVNTTNTDDLRAAGELLVKAKEHCLGFEGAVGGRNGVLRKTAAVAIVYSGDAVRGMEEDPDTQYFIPREGSEIWIDSLCIPAKAPHRDLAEKFINFMLEAKISARCSEYGRAGTPNKAAREFVNPTLLTNSAIYPSAEVMRNLEYADDLAEGNKLYEDLWTRIKAR